MKLICNDAICAMQTLSSESVDCIITSPPYYNLRNYKAQGQMGVENTPEAYVQNLVNVFREAHRVLKPEGTVWLNLGDSYARSGKRKNLIGTPWRVAFALQNDGWILRNDIIWQKPNAMPESVKDRLTTSHEHIFLLTKSTKYFFDFKAILEPAVKESHLSVSGEKRTPKRGSWVQLYGKSKQDSVNKSTYTGFNKRYCPSGMRRKRDVWSVNSKPNLEAHFATYPEELITPCIKAGCPEGGVVLDMFMGTGTTGVAAKHLGRDFIGIDIVQEYCAIAERRLCE